MRNPALGYMFAALVLLTVVHITPAAIPSIPQGVTAEAGDGFVHCSWQAVPEANVTYTLYRCHAESSSLVSIASGLTATAYVDTSAVNGTAYRYAVAAKDSAGGQSSVSGHALANPVGMRNTLIFYAVWANSTTQSINPGTGDCWIMTQAYSGYPAWNWWGKPWYAANTGDKTIKNNYKMYFGTPSTPNNALLDWHAQLLTEARIDAVVLDLTNGTGTDIVNGAKALCKRFGERMALGLPTPKVIVWVKDEATLQHMKTYVLDVYPKEVFFYYLGKKLVCANDTGTGTPAVPTDGIWGTYTSRRMWALGAVGTTGKIWSFKTAYSTPPLPFMYNGEPEQMAAVVATQSSRMTEDGINPAPGAVGRQNGAFFNKYMDAAIAAGPRFLFIHSWNEWTAQNLNQTPGMAQFVDQWRTEYSSDVEPMDGGHGWDYYYLMKDRVAEYKATTPTSYMLHYRFDGDMLDSGGNNYHGTLTGGGFAPSLVQHDQGLVLDGVDDYVTVSNYKGVAGGSSRTCATWIKKPGSASNTVITSWGANAAGQQWLFGLFNTGQLVLYTGGPYIKVLANIADNRWHHVAAVLTDDGSPNLNEVKLYIDGQLRTDTYVAGSQAINTVLASPVRIGCLDSAGIPTFLYNGQIDDVRIYNYALTTEDIAQLAAISRPSLDIIADNIIDTHDLLALAGYWLDGDCYSHNLCDGRDVNADELVSLQDFQMLAVSWLMQLTPPGFQEVNGMIVIEAEHYDNLRPSQDDGNVAWGLRNDVAHYLEGPTSNGEYIYVGTNSVSPNYTNFGQTVLDNAPRLDYTVNAVTGGTYYIWARGNQNPGNSVFVVADFNLTAAAPQGAGNWVWWNDDQFLTPAAQVTLTPGGHTISIYQREENCGIDKLILTVNPGYIPTNLGPAESPR